MTDWLIDRSTLVRLGDATPLASMPVEYLTPAIEDRAVEVERLLADGEHHRARLCPTC